MRTILLFVLCFLGLVKSADSQSIVSITPDHGTIGEFFQATAITSNTTNASMYWANFCLVQNGVVKQVYGHGTFDDTLSIIFVYMYQALSPGMYDLGLYFPDNTVVIKPNAFRVDPDPDPASLVSTSPDTALQGQIFYLDITGLNTHFDYNTNYGKSYLKHGNYTLESQWQLAFDATHKQCKFQFPFTAPLGMYDIVAGDELNGVLNKPAGFELKSNPDTPRIVSATPGHMFQGQSGDLTITGIHTLYSFNTYIFDPVTMLLRKSEEPFKGHEIGYSSNAPVVLSNLAVKVFMDFPYAEPPGTYDVITKDGLQGNLLLNAGFTLLPGPFPPSILSVSPDSIHAVDSMGNMNLAEILTVHGRNTHFGDCQLVYGDTYYCWYHKYINDSTFEVIVYTPYQITEGWHSMELKNCHDGNFVVQNAFYMINPTYGTPEISSGQFRVFPNPSTGRVQIKTGTAAGPSALLTLMDMQGQVLEQLRFPPGSNALNLELSGLRKGLYLLRLNSGVGSSTRKLVLQ